MKKTKLKGKSLKPPKELVEGLKELRYVVENPNKRPDIALRQGGIYRLINREQVQTLTWKPWEFGYQVKEDLFRDGFFTRNVFIKLKGSDIGEIPEREMGMITEAVSHLLDVGQGPVIMSRIAFDCIKMSQQFQVFYLKEMKPNLV